ncbi:MAG: phosphoglucosamine mutase [Deltaproteobacteria bacterium]|nr:phosphoglucosamine mutase [Deltaproteobacteria bacterium]MCB9478381.1 phosphoglucosamine mutase [Deltaproteobacteria bacterium]
MQDERRYFGTDGIRGVANQDPMTTDVAMRVGRAMAYLFKKDNERRHRVIIGKDTRRSSYMIEFAMAAGICSAGVDTLLVGPLPTPGIAFVTRDMRADAGVVISASHNPFQDNGIKFFDPQGFKLPDDVELRIEQIMLACEAEKNPVTAGDVGRAWRIDDAIGRYIVFLKKSFPANRTLEGVKLVVDCANGAGYKVAPSVFEELGAELVVIGNRPDGRNINDQCGALYPGKLGEKVREVGADAGIALDGDADRLIVVDEKGEEVDGDHIIAALGKHMLAEGRLKKNTVVATIMSNLGLDVALREVGGNVVRSAVGDRYVIEMMRDGGYNFGGEKSGHLIHLDEHTTGDGIMSALQVLACMLKLGKPMSELAKSMHDFPQILENVHVKEKRPFDEVPEIDKAIRSAQLELGEKGRVVVRYSGTELLARVMVEGENPEIIRRMSQDIIGAITTTLA